MSFIIDPSSISSTQIEADLTAFLLAQPDSARWKDFFDSSTGKQIIKLIAGLGTFLEYNIITARRETFLPYVTNRTSGIASSNTLGYSPYRGRNAVVSLTIVPNISSLLPKYSIIGTVKEKDLILLEDTIFNAGVSNTFLACVGNLLDETITVDTESIASFRFTQNNMSQDVRVLLNDVEMASSERILDLINQKFVIQSNVNGAVSVMYLNLDTFPIRYTIGDKLKVQYLELNNFSFNLSNIICDIGTISTSSFDTVFQDVESLDNIKINAPLFHETQFTIRGRDDYMKVFRLLDSNIEDTNYTDVSAAIVKLTYVTDNLSLFSDIQLFNFIQRLIGYRPMGLEPPTIKHPRPVFLTLNVSIKLLNNSGNPSSDVDLIINSKEGILENEILFADLEKELEDLSFTKIARTNIATTVWAPNTYYVRGHHSTPITPNGKIYEMNDYVCSSGLVQPAFATLSTPIIDNKVLWCEDIRVLCVDDGIPTWQPNTVYKEDTYVVANPILLVGTTSNGTPILSSIVTTNLEPGMLIVGPNIQPNTFILSKTINTVTMDKNATAAGTNFITFILMKKFRACGCVTTAASIMERQQLTFSPTPDNGTYRVEYNGVGTIDLPFNASSSALQNAINNIPGLGLCSNPIYLDEASCLLNGGTWQDGQVTVTGSYNTGFQISFDGLNANQDQPELTLIDSGANEVQCFDFDFIPTSGTWQITFDGQTTALLPFNASIALIKIELENLSNVAVGEVTLTGNINPSKHIQVTFVNGLGLQDQPQMTIFSNTLIAGLTVTITPSTITGGVAPIIGTSETQYISFSNIPTTGDFSLTYEFVTTSLLNQTTTASSLQAALEALLSIGVGNVSVTGSFASGFTVNFINALSLSNRSNISLASNSLARAQNVSATVTSTQEGGGGFNEIQKIDFNYQPNLGSWQLKSDGSEYATPVLPFNISAASLQTYLESLSYSTTGDTFYYSTILSGDTNLTNIITNIVTTNVIPGMTISGSGIVPGTIVLSKTLSTVTMSNAAIPPSPELGVSLTFTSASNIVTNIVTTNVEVGTTVTGIGIPASTTVLSKTINTVTLSNPVTIGTISVSLTFTRNNVGDITVSGNFINGFVVSYNGSLANVNVPILTLPINTLTADLSLQLLFSTLQDGESPVPGISEVQKLSFNKVPDSGVYKLNFNGDITANINFSDNNSAVETALELLPSIGVGNVTVTGSYAAGFTISFIGALAVANQPLIIIDSSTLFASAAPIVVTPCTITEGRTPANNLYNGVNPITATVITTDDGSNPEPDWFSGAPIC